MNNQMTTDDIHKGRTAEEGTAIQPFKALSRICLNNWHYIDRKVLSFSEGINFFTGHSGSGKSTVIDAMQIVLYANTDGRAFFNKAAADDSDRSLIEYLRGMVNIGENNDYAYLRNKNFSSTIVLELMRTDTRDRECIGVVFDVDTATNEIARLFFWHRGGLPEHCYRTGKRSMATFEVKDWMQKEFNGEEYFCGSHNERFRRQLYDIYLGGLDMEKFPLLFKRAIPFRMNIKLEDFVKEYICMEKDIQIEDMQESVMQYGRMRRKIEDTMEEIRELTAIGECHQEAKEKERAAELLAYTLSRFGLICQKERTAELTARMELDRKDLDILHNNEMVLNTEIQELKKQQEEIIGQIQGSGYEALEAQLGQLNELLERLTLSRGKWDRTAEHLKDWESNEVTSNQMLWDIEKFRSRTISEGELHRLKAAIAEIREEKREEAEDIRRQLSDIRKREKLASEELRELKQGKKAYPKELEDAKREIYHGLKERFGRPVEVRILADLLDIRDETWRNAVEGYLGGNKLNLIVEPKYAEAAMEIYETLNRKKYWHVAVLDTEKIMKREHSVRLGSLAEEVLSKEPYVQAYIRFLLGNVIKCRNVHELRRCEIGVTADCMRYRGYRLQHMNPEDYTRRAYIGEVSVRKRIRQLEAVLRECGEAKQPLEAMQEEIRRIQGFDDLNYDTAEYMSWLADIRLMETKEKEKQKLTGRLRKMKEETIDFLKNRRKETEEALLMKDAERTKLIGDIRSKEDTIRQNKQLYIEENERLLFMEQEFVLRPEFEEACESCLKQQKTDYEKNGYDAIQNRLLRKFRDAEAAREEQYAKVTDLKTAYLRKYPNRTFSPTDRDNAPYDRLLSELACDDLEQYKKLAAEQARAAVEHFKDDFIFKIRSAIREAMQRRDELNRVIRKLDFGKDKYEFVITKNKGADGKYYDMFMDDALQIKPSQLSDQMENQLNFFTMEHEDHYGDVMNELIGIFIPPDNATPEELEEAKRNMEKYADYRTYLSFDMQQIVRGEDGEVLKIRLSKMIKKNSGGEGQNPLYVALLASFAQAYRINLSPKLRRSPTLRLVVLDEAFSKMDAEKVASCIELIRGLGFQAIISATNDKIQNYLENVDKTFVFANPNKKCISIQEFEKQQFALLGEES